MAAPAESPPLAADTELPLRPDIFVSYSRSDEEFVRRLAAALEARGKDVWVDLSDIRKGADWHAKMLAGVESARVIVPVLSTEFAVSEPCAEEIEHAVEYNKRLVPIVRHPVERGSLRAELTAPNWIFFDEDERFDEAADELVEAAEADFDWLDEHARLLARALEWKRANDRTKPSLLLRGGDLDAAEDWLAAQGEHRERATPEQIDYIVASRRGATRRHRMTIGAVSLALAVSVGLTIFALIKRSQAIHQSNLAGSRELAIASTAALGDDPELGLLLAQRAAEKAPTPEATAALRTALDESRVRIRLRPGGPVVSAVFSPDGTRVLTASRDSTVRVWRADDGRSAATFHSTGKLDDAEFRPDGREIVTSSVVEGAETDYLELWDLRSGRRVGRWKHPQFGASATYSADGRFILTLGFLGPAAMWRFDGAWHLVHTFGGGHLDVHSAELSADGKRVLTSISDLRAKSGSPSADFARVWSATTGKRLIDFRGKDALGNTARFSPDGRFVVTTGFGTVARIWDAATGRRVGDLAGHQDAVNDARFSADGRLVVTASHDGTARVWDARTARQLLVLRGHSDPVATASFSADGRHVVTAGADGTARIWDVSGVIAQRTRGPIVRNTIARSADASVEVDTGPKGATIWNVHPRRQIGRFALVDRANRPADVVFSPNGLYILALGSTGEATLWDVRQRRSVAHFRRVETLDRDPFSADGARVEVRTKHGFGIWDVRAGRYVLHKPTPAGNAFTVGTISPDGRTAVTGQLGSAWAWDIRAGKGRRLFSTDGGVVELARFSPDGSRLVAGVAKSPFLWDVAHHRRIATLHGHTELIFRVIFSADASRILTTALDETARLWDGRTGTPIAVLRIPSKFVTSAAFSQDGRFIATTSGDDAIRISDGQTGAPVTVIRTGRGYVFTAAFVGKTTDLLATRAGGAPWLVRCDLCAPVDDLLALSRRRVTRDLTPAERKKYLHA